MVPRARCGEWTSSHGLRWAIAREHKLNWPISVCIPWDMDHSTIRLRAVEPLPTHSKSPQCAGESVTWASSVFPPLEWLAQTLSHYWAWCSSQFVQAHSVTQFECDCPHLYQHLKQWRSLSKFLIVLGLRLLHEDRPLKFSSVLGLLLQRIGL